MNTIKAKKGLGQHFLRSEKALQQIVDCINVDISVPVFEIGPGEGVLTRKVLEKGYKVKAVEIDREAITYLNDVFFKEIQDGKLEIIERNVLEMEYPGKYYLLGNIPYYITGAIFRHTFEQKNLPSGAVFLIQKEVGERIVARDKKESILSISVKIFGEAKVVDVVKAGSFSPPPKVDSVILKVENIRSPFGSGSERVKIEKEFFRFLRAAFAHKRKFVLSNIKTELGEEEKVFMQKYVTEKQRAEDIPLNVWKEIASDLNLQN